jgi:hypothetical protein
MKKTRKIFVALAKSELEKEFGWFYTERWGEDAVKTYLTKHPEKIDKDLTLLGVGELAHPELRQKGRSRIDMIFRKGDIYYIVEVKDTSQSAWTQLFEEVACFECDMKRHKESYSEIIPVCVCVENKESPPHQSDWSEDNEKDFQKFWKLCNCV